MRFTDTEKARIREDAALFRARDPAFADWAAGYGVIRHEPHTQVRVRAMADLLVQRGLQESTADVYALLRGADRIASAAMWLVGHMTYAQRVFADGRDLQPGDFKPKPEGHSGGSLNMAIAYTGYFAANALSAITRSWLMGQGHCVSAIDAVNLLLDNLSPVQAGQYDLSEAGLSRFVSDFYSYRLLPDGSPASPLGSHVNAHTAGGMMEGGYLGFAELQYPHMPLPGEQLVAFLSDGAFEEQRGGDWAPRWWRAEDTGRVIPIMIANGRRIDQRSSMAMKGGTVWLEAHLEQNGFAPIELDGRDPASIAWGILEMDRNLGAAAGSGYPVALPYGIAGTEKGFGFPNAGTNLAHNLPLGGNPHQDAKARQMFNQAAGRLRVPWDELAEAIRLLNRHGEQGRPKERDHPLGRRNVQPPELPSPAWKAPSDGEFSPMAAVDDYFVRIVEANPHLRVRVGNPDEMRSNRLDKTLALLKHRVTCPEPGLDEAVDGRVITALNEEAVVSAALANKAGLNLVASYEAFATKMLGALRQEITFARNRAVAGDPPGWLSVPVFATSHTWENGKNELSHQNTTFAETLMGEMSDQARVVFPADANSALAALGAVYRDRGRIWGLVTPKRPIPHLFTAAEAEQLVREGALQVRGSGEETERVLIVATGAYQLLQAHRAADRLEEKAVPYALVYLFEPGRYRVARDEREGSMMAHEQWRDALFPARNSKRVFVSHIRPEAFLGTIWPLVISPANTRALGFINRGGTLDVSGMLFANRSTWAHVVDAIAAVTGRDSGGLLTQNELDAIRGRGDPAALFQ